MPYIRGGGVSLNNKVPSEEEEFSIGDLSDAVIKLLPKGSTLSKDCFILVIPGMLVGTSHIYKVVANGEPDIDDAGRKVTIITSPPQQQ